MMGRGKGKGRKLGEEEEKEWVWVCRGEKVSRSSHSVTMRSISDEGVLVV